MQNDGGPAFPTPESHGDDYEGMSLRDYFAAKALQGFMTHQGWIGYMDTPEHRANLLDSFARDSYAVADAMLRARSKP